VKSPGPTNLEFAKEDFDGHDHTNNFGARTSGVSGETEDKVKMMTDVGMHPVRGLRLNGPPGCGKIALTRETPRLLTGTSTQSCVGARTFGPMGRWLREARSWSVCRSCGGAQSM